MAMRILTSRLVQTTSNSGSLPVRACLTAQISSSTPAAPPTKSKSPVPVVAEAKVKRESLRSRLASIFGGRVDPADPSQPAIPADEVNFPNIVDRATGEEKLLLLAFENGVLDPYCNLPIERRGRGSRDNPVKVESFFDERIVACVCEPMQNSHRFSVYYKGEPKRCQCGHWIEVVDAPRFWEKIPKEDLVQVDFFKKLEEKGKLDKFLETGELEENHAHGHH